MFTHSTARRVVGASVAIAVAMLVACQGEPIAPESPALPGPTGEAAGLMMTCSAEPYQEFPGGGEGEIFGSIFSNEVRICPSEMLITLQPDNPVSNFDAELVPSEEFTHMWEFWDINASDGPCIGARSVESPHADGAGSNKERHCVTQGRHQFTGPKPGGGTRSFYVEYPAVITPLVLDTTNGGSSYVGVIAYHGQGGVYTSIPNDLVIHSDTSSTTFADTVRLYVDASLGPDTARFGHHNSINVDSSYTFRASTFKTGVEWYGHEQGRFLARLHRRVGAGSWTAITDFYMPNGEGGGKLRKFKLPGPTGCPTSAITYTIGLEILQPNQQAGSPSADTAAQRQVTVSCPSGPPALDPPTGVGASSVAQSSATVSWSNGAGPSGVTTSVQYNNNEGGSWTTVSGSPFTASTTTSANLTGLAAGTIYDVWMWHDSAGVRSDTTVADNLFTTTVPAPTSLGSTGVDAASATVTWTNSLSTTGTTTEVEYKSTGSYAAATPAATAGATSKLLSGLSANTTYDVRIRHLRNGQASSWLETLDLFTTDEEPIPPEFTWSSCTRYYSLSKWRIKHTLGWTGATGSWQVREAATNDTTSGSVIASGSSGTSMETGEYLEMYAPLYSYFWVKVAGSAWTPLLENALETTSCPDP